MTHHKNDQKWTHWLLNGQNRRFEKDAKKAGNIQVNTTATPIQQRDYTAEELKGINNIGKPAVEAYIKSVLLNTLDIKEDNNYDIDHQYLVNTDSKWQSFTGSTKWELKASSKHVTSWDKKLITMSHVLPSYLLTRYLQAGCNPYIFTTYLVNALYESLNKFEESKNRKAVNTYLIENGLPPLDDETFNNLKEKLKEDYEERRLTF